MLVSAHSLSYYTSGGKSSLSYADYICLTHSFIRKDLMNRYAGNAHITLVWTFSPGQVRVRIMQRN